MYNGYKIPVVGFGTYALKENVEEIMKCLVSKPPVLIDCADNYDNEELIGNAICKIAERGDDIASVVLMTKFSSPRHSAKLEKHFEQSQKQLNHRINIYLLHWPYPFLWKIQWRQMEKLYTDGKVDAIGVCNFDKKTMQKMLKFCKVKPMINQYECHPMFVQKEVADYCEKNDIQIVSYSPLARCDKRLFENPVLLKISQEHKKSVSQIILRWNYQHRYIPIPATTKIDHIDLNFDIFDFELSSREMQKLDSLDCNMRIRMDVKTRFGLKKRIEYFMFRVMAIFKICIW